MKNKTDKQTPRTINLNLRPRRLYSTALAKCLFPCSIDTAVFSTLYSI